MQNVDKNTQVLLNKYIRDNIENDFIVDPLIIDCDINDNQLIEEYICKKIQRGRVMDISFCQNLGNIAKKYPLTQNIITAFFRTISGNPRQFNYRDESAALCVSAQKI